MRLRHESRLKEKLEFQLDTKHVLYLVMWSIVLSGAIFATGLFIGQKKEAGKAGYAVTGSLAFKGLKQKEAHAGVDPLVSSFSFLSRLDRHPEHKELDDAVLNALAKMRLEVREKVMERDEELKKELAEKYFPSDDGLAEQSDAQRRRSAEMLAQSQGVSAAHEPRIARVGPAPADLGKEVAEEEGPKAPYADAKLVKGPPAHAALKAPPQVVVQADSEADAPGAFAIQAKAFRDKKDADIFVGYLQSELRKSKFKPFVMPVELPGKGRWYRVRIGKFDSRLAAEKFKTQFEKRLGLETFLVSL